MSERHDLASIFALERADGDEFVARFETFGGFGGDVLARAVLAAARTCDGKELHSLHTYFLRPVPAGVPVALQVERLKEGRGFGHRRVSLRHQDRLLCEMTASFAATRDGVGFQEASHEPVAAPEEVPSDVERARAERWPDWSPGPVEWRWIGSPWRPLAGESSHWSSWVRPRTPLPADPPLHAAALAFLSDFSSHWATGRRLGFEFATDWFVSLDTALWATRPIRWDGWWLIRSSAEAAHAGRVFTRREVYTREGHLLACVVQEALVARR